MRPSKIISGGQTGADQGGLAAAVSLDIPTGGMAPKGFRTELGNQPDLLKGYGLVETFTSDYRPRTVRNVQNSDATIWFGNEWTPGYKCTISALRHKCRDGGYWEDYWLVNPKPDQLFEFVDEFDHKILNIAGNRESTNPGIYRITFDTIVRAFKDV